jgi:dihydroorotate dehydrogenase
MFRLIEDMGIVNRYGFNSQGVVAVEENLKQYRDSEQQQLSKSKDPDDTEKDTGIAGTMRWIWSTLYPEQHAVGGIVGVNIGKNKLTPDAAHDFCENIRRLPRH